MGYVQQMLRDIAWEKKYVDIIYGGIGQNGELHFAAKRVMAVHLFDLSPKK